MLKTKCIKLTIALIVLMGTSIISSGQKVLNERLPQIEDFTATFLDKPTESGNVVLSLKFSGREELPETFAIKIQKGTLVEFTDSGERRDSVKGDGVFTALAFFTKDEILTPQIRRGGTFPVFKGREFVGNKKFPPIKDIKANVPINLNRNGNPSGIDPERSLMVTDPSVVQDRERTRTSCDEGNMGVWSFGYLMTEMANQSVTGITPEDFTMMWLKNWMDDQIVNSFVVGERNAGVQNLINNWAKNPDGTLDLSKAPFRLLGIVNRVDLRGTIRYGEAGNSAGELRFVFGLVDPQSCEAQRQTVIFEYGVHKDSCEDIQNWGILWKKLDNFVLGSPEYNAALEDLTQQIVKANAVPDNPNGSSLNQLRTNDFVFDRPWELREFIIGDGRGGSGFLTEATIKQTPDAMFNQTSTLKDFVNTNEIDILAGTHTVPLDFLGSPFLGGAIEYDSSDFWEANGINNNEARHLFSLNTCNSCHGRESDTGFLHLTPVNFGGGAAPLSTFLRGNTPDTTDIEFSIVQDPVDANTSRKFNDLLRRAADLDALINTPCKRMFAVTPPQMTH